MATIKGREIHTTPSDIETYARHVEGVDPARYYDSQAREVLEGARTRWPLLASVLVPLESQDVD